MNQASGAQISTFRMVVMTIWAGEDSPVKYYGGPPNPVCLLKHRSGHKIMFHSTYLHMSHVLELISFLCIR